MPRIANPAPWVPVIGEIMVAFGYIEHSINELLSNVCSEGVLKVVVTLPLSQRVRLLKEALPDWKDLSEPNKEVLRQNLDEVTELAKTRNLMAHNPLVFTAFVDKRGKLAGKDAIWSRQKDKAIGLPELKEVAERAVRLSDALSSNWLDYDMAVINGKQVVFKLPFEVRES